MTAAAIAAAASSMSSDFSKLTPLALGLLQDTGLVHFELESKSRAAGEKTLAAVATAALPERTLLEYGERLPAAWLRSKVDNVFLRMGRRRQP
jgi:hypothetical protein